MNTHCTCIYRYLEVDEKLGSARVSARRRETEEATRVAHSDSLDKGGGVGRGIAGLVFRHSPVAAACVTKPYASMVLIRVSGCALG
jgi:hypothetical protein